MRQDWEQWEPRGRRMQPDAPNQFMGGNQPPLIQDPSLGQPSGIGMTYGNPSVMQPGLQEPYQYPTLQPQYESPQSVMSPSLGNAYGNPQSPQGPFIPQNYGSSVFDVQPQYPKQPIPTGGIVPPGYGSQASGQPSSGYYDNPSMGQSPQLPQQNQWAAIGRQSSVQPQPMLNNWWAGGR